MEANCWIISDRNGRENILRCLGRFMEIAQTMKTSPPLSRKDLAAILGFETPKQIARNERRLGLFECRVMINSRLIRYHEARAMAALRRLGLI